MIFGKICLVAASLLAFLAPLKHFVVSPESYSVVQFPGWPEKYEDRTLTQIHLTDREKVFVKNFPGKIARFSDGQRELIIRWLEKPTRMLHPAADCFKGLGYTIHPRDIEENTMGIKMSCFNAVKDSISLNVCEYIESTEGENWSDVSAWYWGAILGSAASGWMSYVIAENNLKRGEKTSFPGEQ